VNGYAAYPPKAYVEIGDIAFGMPSAEALRGILDRVDVRWVLLHLKPIPPMWRPAWLAPLDAALRRVGEWPDAVLYEVPRPSAGRPPHDGGDGQTDRQPPAAP
jgi:hypothetical protein